MPTAFTFRYTTFDRFLCFFLVFIQHILLFFELRAYAIGSACYILAFTYYFLQRKTFRKIAFTFPMVVWIILNVYHVINALYNNVPSINYFDWLHAFKPYCCMVLVCYWCILDFNKTVKTLCFVYALILLFFLLTGYETMSENAEGSGRLSSTVAAVSVGHWAGVMSIFISLYCLMNNVSLIRTMLMFAYSLAFTFFSQGRVSMIMILFSIIGYAYSFVKTGGRRALSRVGYVLVTGLLGAAFLYAIYVNSGLSKRVAEGTSYREQYFYTHTDVNPILDRIAGDRVIYYYYGWQFFKDKPITGIGLENYRYLTGGEFPIHSDYMVNLAEGGLVAFSLYLLFYIYVIYNLWKIPKEEKYKYVAVMGVVTLLVIAIWTGVFRFENYSPVYGIILYLIYKHKGIIRVVD